MLTNVAYLGKLRYKTEIHDGEHDALVDADVWQRVQALLGRNGRTGGAAVRNKFGALLKGILRCTACDCAMSPTHSTKNGNKRYRYYVCTGAQKRGWHTCPSKSIPAGELERFVAEQIKCVGRDPTLLHETIAQAQRQGRSHLAALETERTSLERELSRWNAEVRKLLKQIAPDGRSAPTGDRLADLQDRIAGAERRATEVREQVLALSRTIIDDREVAQPFAVFDPVWDSLTPREQARIVQLLVERVDYNGATGKVAITFHPSGIKTLAEELNARNSEEAA